MDALPVAEEVDLPFASRVKAMWSGKETGVMRTPAATTGMSPF
jgi:hypothetical protein